MYVPYLMIKNYVWRGGGVPGGGFKHAGNADWFVEMNPVSSMAPSNPPKPSSYSTPFYGDLKIPPVKYRQKKTENVKRPVPGQKNTVGNIPGYPIPSNSNIDGRTIGPNQRQPYSADEIMPELASATTTESTEASSEVRPYVDPITPSERARWEKIKNTNSQQKTFVKEVIQEEKPVEGTWNYCGDNNCFSESYKNSIRDKMKRYYKKNRGDTYYDPFTINDRNKPVNNLYEDQINVFSSQNVSRQEKNKPVKMDVDNNAENIVQRTQVVKKSGYNAKYFDEMGEIYGKKFPETTRYRKRKQRQSMNANKKINSTEMSELVLTKGKNKRQSTSNYDSVVKQRITGDASSTRGKQTRARQQANNFDPEIYKQGSIQGLKRKRIKKDMYGGVTKRRAVEKSDEHMLR